jgi:hypothetical protein
VSGAHKSLPQLTMRSDVLASALTHLYNDRLTEIHTKDILTYSHTADMAAIQTQLEEWKRAGYLVILKPVKDCADREPCVRLLGSVPIPEKTS